MSRIRKRIALLVVLPLVVGLGLCLAYSYEWLSLPGYQRTPKAEKAAPLVTVMTARKGDLPVKIFAQGHLVPLNQVDVRPQRSGTVRQVHFREGDDVEAGQILFTLDASDTAAQLNRTQAQAAQIKAQLDDAMRDYSRSKEMLKARFVSSSAVDTSASKVESLRAQHSAALADVENVRVQLDRSRIVAPISGKAGALKVYRGSLAQESNSTPLVTLIQFDPIGVEFSIPERQLAAVLEARSQKTLKVSLQLSDESEEEGAVTFINNTVNASTGAISLKARFPNKDQKLWPGAFARVTLSAGYRRDAMALPPQALIAGTSGHFVYVLTDGGEVAVKPVTLLYLQDRRAVVGGLDGGEGVVIEGNQNLRAGMKVRARASEKQETAESQDAPLTGAHP